MKKNTSNTEFTKTKVESSSHLQQLLRLQIAQEKCYARIKSDPPVFTSGVWCNRTWDGITCWGDTNASTTASQKCPSYIHGFNKFDYAFRTCTATGEWYQSSRTNKTWTDYSQCMIPQESLYDHINNILSIANFGYAASLLSLSAAIVIMVSCRRFYYKSNILHINLFLAFCFRALFSLLRQNLFTYGYAMSIDMEQDGGELKFKDGPHWECRLLFTFFMYGLSVSQVWVFVEGLYLQMLIYRTLFTQQRSVKYYITFGWCFPLTFLVPWVLVRVYYDNTLCWSINRKLKYVWITRGPITATILINFLFFLDNLRVLLQRTQARGNRRTYSSFQGLILALLFCFLHEEVHANIKRAFNRYVMRQRNTMSLRSSISQRQNSLHTQNTQYQNSEIEDVIQLHLIHANKLYSEREGKVCNKATNNGSKANMNSCTSFTSNIVALTHTCNCRFSDQQQQQQQPIERQKTQISYLRNISMQ